MDIRVIEKVLVSRKDDVQIKGHFLWKDNEIVDKKEAIDLLTKILNSYESDGIEEAIKAQKHKTNLEELILSGYFVSIDGSLIDRGSSIEARVFNKNKNEWNFKCDHCETKTYSKENQCWYMVKCYLSKLEGKFLEYSKRNMFCSRSCASEFLYQITKEFLRDLGHGEEAELLEKC